LMPVSPPRPCTVCRALVSDGTGRCEQHKFRLNTFADRRRGSRHERGYGAEWEKKRERVMERDGGLCQTCHRAGYIVQASAVDHIVPRFEGGSEDDDNLEAICKTCHDAKTARENKRARAANAQPAARQRPR